MKTKPPLLSLHAFVAGRENAFLANVVAPVLKRSDVDVDAFFFLRYWRGGPHLRLRFRAAPAACTALHELLMRQFDDWCAGVDSFDVPGNAEHAALASRFAALEGVAADTALVSCPALVEAAYEPESHKYGGECGLSIAEPVWRTSTAAIMSVASEALQGSGTRLALGMQMAVVAVRAFDLERTGALDFFKAHASKVTHARQ